MRLLENTVKTWNCFSEFVASNYIFYRVFKNEKHLWIILRWNDCPVLTSISLKLQMIWKKKQTSNNNNNLWVLLPTDGFETDCWLLHVLGNILFTWGLEDALKLQNVSKEPVVLSKWRLKVSLTGIFKFMVDFQKVPGLMSFTDVVHTALKKSGTTAFFTKWRTLKKKHIGTWKTFLFICKVKTRINTLTPSKLPSR